MGGIKNDKGKPGLDMLSSKALLEIARVMDHGAKKYAKNNWREGIAFSRIYAAIMRHLLAWNDGESLDPETGISHLAHASCGLMFLLEFEKTRPDLDDRYKKEISEKPITIYASEALDYLNEDPPINCCVCGKTDCSGSSGI